MSIDEKTIRHIASLAAIKIEEKEVPQLAMELSKIVDWVEQLSEVNTENIAPLTSAVEAVIPHREDVVNDGDIQNKILENAPQKDDGFFAVPKMVE
ncbi:MAG: Asp-tRNA(Asn)/Glu-tRNA(Gln) amidotransferase subunit GatC [Parvibaculales bacterium]